MTTSKLQLASFPRRFWAYFLDVFFCFVLSIPVTIVALHDVFRGHDIFWGWPLLIVQNVVLLIYTVCFLMWDGATPGKWLMGVRIVDRRSEGPLTLFQALVRAITAKLTFFFCFLPQAVAFFRLDRRQLADLLAATIVVETEPAQAYILRRNRPILGVLIVLYSLLQVSSYCTSYFPRIHLDRDGVTIVR